MASRSLRTAEYDEAVRRILGNAVIAARKRVFRKRSEFLRAHPEVKPTSLYLIEHAKPLVGSLALEAVGEALGAHFPGLWTTTTPQRILEGARPPDLSAPPPVPPVPEVDTDESPLGHYSELSATHPAARSEEWLYAIQELLEDHEEFYLEVRLLVRENGRLAKRIVELERLLTERDLPHEGVTNTQVSPNR